MGLVDISNTSTYSPKDHFLSLWTGCLFGERVKKSRGEGSERVFFPLSLWFFSPFPQTDSLFLFPLLEILSPFPQTESLFTGYHFLNKTIDMCSREIIFTLKLMVCPELLFADHTPVVQKVNNTIHWINNYYPVDKIISFPNTCTYPLVSNLSSG